MGDWQKAPSGVNQKRKLELLKDEGVSFDRDGRLIEVDERGKKKIVWFDGPWKV